MEIIIPLPRSSSANTYKELMGYLKQFELAIHHAQKAVENAENTGIKITEESFVVFIHPALQRNISIDLENQEFDGKLGKDVLGSFEENYYDELQNVELHINLN